MIEFVNAKINIGLQVVEKRTDGYHNLQTVFYPVGKRSGTHSDPGEFCDILEAVADPGISNGLPGAFGFEFRGRDTGCPPDRNLVCRAARLFASRHTVDSGVRIILDKHLPDGAGMGGGSADAAFTLRMLNAISGYPFSSDVLARMAAELGADCPFFIYNRPMYGEGIGDVLTDIALDLSGFWLTVVKPDIYVSTAEAFGGIIPRRPEFDLRDLPSIPPEEWAGKAVNDFETTVFKVHPALARIKSQLSEAGAAYASMTGSGSCIYGLFRNREKALTARDEFAGLTTIEGAYLLEL